jgi:hypothetical protein
MILYSVLLIVGAVSSWRTPRIGGGASRHPLQPFGSLPSVNLRSTKDFIRWDRLPVRSIELEQFEFLGTPPLCKDDSLRPVMFGDP